MTRPKRLKESSLCESNRQEQKRIRGGGEQSCSDRKESDSAATGSRNHNRERGRTENSAEKSESGAPLK